MCSFNSLDCFYKGECGVWASVLIWGWKEKKGTAFPVCFLGFSKQCRDAQEEENVGISNGIFQTLIWT